jgi:hypothetical protein
MVFISASFIVLGKDQHLVIARAIPDHPSGKAQIYPQMVVKRDGIAGCADPPGSSSDVTAH